MAGKMTDDKCIFCGKPINFKPRLFIRFDKKTYPCCNELCFHSWICRKNGINNYDKEKVEQIEIIEKARRSLERYNQTRIASIPLDQIIDPYPPLSTANVQLYSYDLHKVGTDKPYLIRLSEDIRINGVKEPITVTVQPNGKYCINEGHNRFTCCKLLGIIVIPAIINRVTTAIDDRKSAILRARKPN